LEVIRTALRGRKDELVGRLWAELGGRDPGRRFRAACALAEYDRKDARWGEVSREVATKLLAENPWDQLAWAGLLHGVGGHLRPPLAEFLEDERRGGAERRSIAKLYQAFAAGEEDAFTRLEKRVAEGNERGAQGEVKVALAKRKANLAVALLLMGR